METTFNPASSYRIRDEHGIYRLIPACELMESAKNHIESLFQTGVALTSPCATRDYLQVLLSDSEHEVFYAIWLNSQNQVIHAGEMFRGTIDGAAVYPREIVKEALAYNAARVIFAHNHPSGSGEPSLADKHITERLVEALKLVDVQVLDHLVIGQAIVSFAERGML